MTILDPSILSRWDQIDPGPEEVIQPEWASVDLSVKRLDKITSWASGNKYYKLKYNIRAALERGSKAIISKGGMFSNHLEALAKACAYFSIPCICIVRSYTPDENNPTIKSLRLYNANIIYTTPEVYDQFDERASHQLEPDAFFIPEGGANDLGFRGTSEIFYELSRDYTHLILAGGTLSTAAGIISVAGPSIRVIVVPAWRGCTSQFLDGTLKQWGVLPDCETDIWPDYHFGGFGKFNPALVQFMIEFTMQTGVPLDPVYNSKMMFGIHDQMQKGYFKNDDRILSLHTGGMQGLWGAYYRAPELWKDYIRIIGSKTS